MFKNLTVTSYGSDQCDQMAKYNVIVWLFTTAEICPKLIKFAKVGSKFCQTKNKPSKVCLDFLNVCPSGEISPNLPTLVVITKYAIKQFEMRRWKAHKFK